MNKLPQPQITPQLAFEACISGLRNQELKGRFKSCTPHINLAAEDYISRAERGELYSLSPSTSHIDSNLTVIGNVSKTEMNDLYKDGMVKRQDGQQIYDKILIAAQAKCPFCGGIGHAKTLDHYLPKAKFPQFSVLPVNLVPCCRDCNSEEKGTQHATTPESQVLHPYFDGNHFYSQQWVFARVLRTDPCVLEFYVEAPEDWDPISKSRAAAHFENFDLAERYSVQAATEFSTLIDQQFNYFGEMSSTDFKKHLLRGINTKLSFANYWRNVMYSSLANDDWFCEQQFRHVQDNA